MLAQRSFFNGFYQVNDTLSRYQDSLLDWSEFENNTELRSERFLDLFVARFVS